VIGPLDPLRLIEWDIFAGLCTLAVMVEVGLMPFINENAPDITQVLYWLDVIIVAHIEVDSSICKSNWEHDVPKSTWISWAIRKVRSHKVDSIGNRNGEGVAGELEEKRYADTHFIEGAVWNTIEYDVVNSRQ